MPLTDPHLNSAFKVQIQITGAPQISSTYAATLHHQMVYIIQNHAFDIAIPNPHSEDALLLKVDSNSAPCCTYVPRQLPRQELVKLLPETWVTTYERLQTQVALVPVQTNNPLFIWKTDGLVEIKFPKPTPDITSSNPFPRVQHDATSCPSGHRSNS